jgi:antitoxin VapB
MIDTHIAKLFKNGASQAVRLPHEFRFEGSEVFATRDDATGDVILSSRPGVHAWQAFFELVHATQDAPQFMAERPMNVVPEAGGVFDDVLDPPRKSKVVR